MSLRLVAAVGLAALLAGCPRPDEPAPPPAGTPSTSPVSASTPQASRPAPPSPWELIPEQTVQAIGWPMLSAVAQWPDPAGLTALAELAPAERPSADRQRALVDLARTVLAPDLLPADPQQALAVDAAGHLHLRLAGAHPASACCETHPTPDPVLSLAFRTGARAAASEAELRQQVADVVNADLRAELSQEAHSLDAHPGLPNAGMAQLDREAGYGMQFPYLYAYSGRGTLVLVFQEEPHQEER